MDLESRRKKIDSRFISIPGLDLDQKNFSLNINEPCLVINDVSHSNIVLKMIPCLYNSQKQGKSSTWVITLYSMTK